MDRLIAQDMEKPFSKLKKKMTMGFLNFWKRKIPGREKPESLSFKEWVKAQADQESYWFHKMALFEDVETAGWSNPLVEKLPHFGLPDDMTGMRVLDIGCAEGFFSFEAERRNAGEVVAIDSFPDSIRRFNICRSAYGSRATAYLCNVYDLSPRTFGTFDMIFFFGVLYHLRHPLLALEKIFQVCAGSLLLQTAVIEPPGMTDTPVAQFHPVGMQSGTVEKPLYDPTVFWMPNSACVKAMLEHVGFRRIEFLNADAGVVYRARSPVEQAGCRPDERKAPWS